MIGDVRRELEVGPVDVALVFVFVAGVSKTHEGSRGVRHQAAGRRQYVRVFLHILIVVRESERQLYGRPVDNDATIVVSLFQNHLTREIHKHTRADYRLEAATAFDKYRFPRLALELAALVSCEVERILRERSAGIVGKERV